ncbi:Peroxin/Ferlin domain [Lasallia pustulata]|uniref:Peroxin/Ferlin domain n=1 Tax=Lasallia pustulata TaxID=136370 RepID=A0A1W5CZ72_9LECA|nr:Peroxin/Ferlin domain [Lasallia pustulata]
MAAFDTPWLDSMSTTPSRISTHGSINSNAGADPIPPTMATFSPSQPSGSKHRSTIIVHQKSPLLVATPPQITRALAFSHPFILPLNKLAGLLSWTSNDPWESFLLVAGFWALTLYVDAAIRWAGPVVVVVGLILGMYSRRYSPLSSTGFTGQKGPGHKREISEGSMRHQKSLDEIVETLKEFTIRCNALLEPLLEITDFLSTQRTATSATTRPALTSLFLRILLVTPVWTFLSFPFIHIITTRRVILTFGTLFLTWHSRPARISRAILWRSLTVRHIASLITGLNFTTPPDALQPPGKATPPPLPPRNKSQQKTATDLAARSTPESSGVRFTFVVYENQRRWLGIGWTHSLLAYERAPWTDEHLNPAPPKDAFELPELDSGTARWRWVEGSEWRVETGGRGGGVAKSPSAKSDANGWIYYDNKWNDGRRGQDSWGRYTRRRKWYRDAELVEVAANVHDDPGPEARPRSSAVAAC